MADKDIKLIQEQADGSFKESTVTPTGGHYLRFNGATKNPESAAGSGAGGTVQGTDSHTLNIRASSEGAVTGNARGENSVDLQTIRANATEVASAIYSTVGGGRSNTASGYASTVSGGRSNTASGYYSTVSGGNINTASGYASTVSGGRSNTASGSRSTVSGGYSNIASGYRSTVSGGQSNTASGYYSTVGGGYGNTASGRYSTIGGGYGNTASGKFSTVGGGYQAKAYLYGQESSAAGYFAAQGDAQRSTLVARKATTDDTATKLFLNGSSERLVIPTDTAWAFTLTVVAAQQDMANIKEFTRKGLIVRDGNSTSISTVDTIGTDRTIGSPGAWAIAVTADDTNEALDIEVTGAAATNIRWVAKVELVEVSYPAA